MRESEINTVGNRDDMLSSLECYKQSSYLGSFGMRRGLGMKREGGVHTLARKRKYMEPNSNSVYI